MPSGKLTFNGHNIDTSNYSKEQTIKNLEGNYGFIECESK